MALSRLPADHEEVSSRSLKEAAMGLEGLVTMELHRGDGSLGTFLGVQAGLAMRSIVSAFTAGA
jgi:hypothetical protein